MLESDALEKWCPLVREASAPVVVGGGPYAASTVAGSSGSGINRDPTSPRRIARCIGSDCMAWVVLTVKTSKAGATGYCGYLTPRGD